MAVRVVQRDLMEALAAHPKVEALVKNAMQEYKSDSIALSRYLNKVAEVDERLMGRDDVAKILRRLAVRAVDGGS